MPNLGGSYSVSFVNDGTKNSSSTSLIGKGVKSENFRDIIVQEKYIKQYTKDLTYPMRLWTRSGTKQEIQSNR